MTPHPRIPPKIRHSRERVELVIELAPQGDCLVPPLVIELDRRAGLAMFRQLVSAVSDLWTADDIRHPE